MITSEIATTWLQEKQDDNSNTHRTSEMRSLKKKVIPELCFTSLTVPVISSSFFLITSEVFTVSDSMVFCGKKETIMYVVMRADGTHSKIP